MSSCLFEKKKREVKSSSSYRAGSTGKCRFVKLEFGSPIIFLMTPPYEMVYIFNNYVQNTHLLKLHLKRNPPQII